MPLRNDKYHPTMAFVRAKLTVDEARRLVLPKNLREPLQLSPGDTLDAEVEADRITLWRVRPKAVLRKKSGVWVYQGEPGDESIPELIDREREKRIRELSK